MTGTALALMMLLGTDGGGFADLQRGDVIARGERIRIVDRAGGSTKGEFRGYEGDGILVAVGGDVRALGEDSVRAIRVRRPDPVWNGALIGILVASPLIFLNSAFQDGGPGSAVPAFVLGAAVWGAVGAGIDALIVRERTVYRDGRPVSRVQPGLVPVVAASGGGGLALRLTF